MAFESWIKRPDEAQAGNWRAEIAQIMQNPVFENLERGRKLLSQLTFAPKNDEERNAVSSFAAFMLPYAVASHSYGEAVKSLKDLRYAEMRYGPYRYSEKPDQRNDSYSFLCKLVNENKEAPAWPARPGAYSLAPGRKFSNANPVPKEGGEDGPGTLLVQSVQKVDENTPLPLKLQVGDWVSFLSDGMLGTGVLALGNDNEPLLIRRNSRTIDTYQMDDVFRMSGKEPWWMDVKAVFHFRGSDYAQSFGIFQNEFNPKKIDIALNKA